MRLRLRPRTCAPAPRTADPAAADHSLRFQQAPQTPADFRVRIGRGSTIQVDPVTLTTNRAGVFAGGDAVTGPATVVEALASGKLAALRIYDYLRHRYPLGGKETRESLTGDLLTETVEMKNELCEICKVL